MVGNPSVAAVVAQRVSRAPPAGYFGGGTKAGDIPASWPGVVFFTLDRIVAGCSDESSG